MHSEFTAFLKKECQLKAGQKVVVGISGGVDSMVLGHLFKEARIPFVVAHCQFGLRGSESETDASFVLHQVEKWGIPYVTKRFETQAYAQENKLSIQMAARELRYVWFEEMRQQHGCNAIAVGTHQGDATETILINLIRGTGLAGLHGIAPRLGQVIRPLLFADRKKVLAFASENDIAFREDSSNQSKDYWRNKIRLEVLPVLKSLNPSLDRTMAKNAQKLKETELLFLNALEELRQEITRQKGDATLISIAGLQENPAVETVLYEMLKPFGFSGPIIGQVLEALNGQAGKQFHSNTHLLTKDRDHLWITPKSEVEETSILIHKHDLKAKGLISLEMHTQNIADFELDTSPKVACLDHDLLQFPLELRKWKAGDHFIPLGMQNHKKVSDFLVDEKVSLPVKEKTFVLLSKGQIVWLVGHRIDTRFKVAGKTKNTYIVQLTSGF